MGMKIRKKRKINNIKTNIIVNVGMIFLDTNLNKFILDKWTWMMFDLQVYIYTSILNRYHNLSQKVLFVEINESIYFSCVFTPGWITYDIPFHLLCMKIFV